jgi:hypothetical protein
VRAETRRHNYDEVILATGRQGGTGLARGLRLDPIHQLRRRWGQRLVIFAADPGKRPKQCQQKQQQRRQQRALPGVSWLLPTAAHNPAADLCPVLIRMRSLGANKSRPCHQDRRSNAY